MKLGQNEVDKLFIQWKSYFSKDGEDNLLFDISIGVIGGEDET